MRFERLLKSNSSLSSVLHGSNRNASSFLFVCEDELLLDEAVTLFIASRIEEEYGHEKAVARLERNGFADVKYYPQDDKVKVDDVKDLLADVYLTPVELKQKYYVINKAQTANEASQNKLLKTLEDTPSSACIILKCTHDADILPTIKSRCVKVEITAFNMHEVEDELARFYPKDERFFFALGVSRGFAGVGIRAIEDELSYRLFSLVRETFLYMKTSKELLHYSALWLNQKASIKQLLDYTELFLSDLMMFGLKCGDQIRIKSCVKDYSQLYKSGYTAEVALKILPIITQSKRKLDYNANVTSVVDATLYSILEVKAKCQK